MLRTGCELCSMGKLLFSCRVPSLSTTLRENESGSGAASGPEGRMRAVLVHVRTEFFQGS